MTLVEEVTTDVVERARVLELDVEPEDAAELLQSHYKILMDEELLLRTSKEKWFLEMKFTTGEDAVKIVEMTTKDLKYHLNLVDKAASYRV